MLSFHSDMGVRLAGVLPTALSQLAGGMKHAVAIVVDGLGWSNFRARKGHARTLASLPATRLQTVNPSTTGAALSTLMTGELPGAHGLIGYQIRHPELGILRTLNDWEHIGAVREWQRAMTVFERGRREGIRSYAIGRPAHRSGGLTEAILSGATYLGGATIEERFQIASRLIQAPEPAFTYLYVDELDRAGHREGAESEAWTRRLEQLDDVIGRFLDSLPPSVSVCLTADHGMIDIHPEYQILLDEDPELLEPVRFIGGEPRFRYLYLRDPSQSEEYAGALRERESHRAWILTRQEAIQQGLFGDVHGDVVDRIGDVILAARKRVVYYTSNDDPQSRAMIGHHGSLTDDELNVPLFMAGDTQQDLFLEGIRDYSGGQS